MSIIVFRGESGAKI